MITLYAPQEALIESARAEMRAGNKSVLIQAATGFGKSVLAAAMIASSQQRGKSAAFVVPRRQLISQMHETFKAFGIEHGFVAAGLPFIKSKPSFICSTMTLVNRLDKIEPDVVFIDEAHIGGAALDKIIRHYKERGAHVILLSATPERLDGKGLGRWADSMVRGPSVSWLIENHYLSDYRLFAPSRPNLSGVPLSTGDYAKGELEKRMMERYIVGDAVEHYRKNAYGKLCVCFCVSVAHSKEMESAFNAAGIPCAHVDSSTKDEDRAEIIRKFARREILVLSNVEIFTTGFDLSSAAGVDICVECISDLRPTKSLALQMQKWGRALRKKPEKAIILDHAGNWREHGLPDADRIWTLEDRDAAGKSNGEKATPIRQCTECFHVHTPAPVCPACGYVYVIDGRKIDYIPGELQEVEKAAPQPLSMAEYKKKVSQLEYIAKKRVYRNPRAWAIKIVGKEIVKRGLEQGVLL